MTRHLRRSAPLLLSTVLLTACSDATTPPAPTTGTLTFDVVTTGVDLDPDGFGLSIGNSDAVALPVNGSSSWSGAAGTYGIAVSGLALNCDVATALSPASVTLGQTTHVAVRVNCTPFLQNAIVYTSDEFGLGEIMAMRPDGSRRVRLTFDQQAYAHPVVSPDGQTIAAAMGSWNGGTWNGWGGIYLLDRFGKTRTKLVVRSGFDGSPAWSPDGRTLAFRSEMPGPYGNYGRIWVIGRDGSGLRQLTPENADSTDYTYDDSPTWSPDGTKVLYSHNGNLWTINPDGTAPTSLGIAGMYPAWSPDGNKITFTWYAGQKMAVFVADRSGANVKQLTTPIQQDEWTRWSPDGRQLVFERVENNAFQLYRIDADGTNLTKLSTAPRSESGASWNPGT